MGIDPLTPAALVREPKLSEPGFDAAPKAVRPLGEPERRGILNSLGFHDRSRVLTRADFTVILGIAVALLALFVISPAHFEENFRWTRRILMLLLLVWLLRRDHITPASAEFLEAADPTRPLPPSTPETDPSSPSRG